MNIKAILTTFAFSILSFGAYATTVVDPVEEPIVETLVYPQIGNKVEYSGTIQLEDGSSLPYTKSLEITSFDEILKEWVIAEEVSVDQTKSTDTDDADEKDLYTHAKYQTLIQTCVGAGGVIEKIKVAAGEFDTCKMTMSEMDDTVIETREIWYGDVPFGVVKSISHDDGQIISYELATYK